MKKLIGIFAVCMMIASTSLYAQQGNRQQMSAEERAKATVEQLKSTLGLKADQEKKVYDLQVKQMDKMRSLMDPNGDREKMRESMQKIQAETTAEMKKILTADQFKKYEELMANRPGMGQGRPGGR